jgi:hypothetical protein
MVSESDHVQRLHQIRRGPGVDGRYQGDSWRTWLSGDRDIFGAGAPLKDVVAEIIAVLVRDTEDEAERTR